MLCVDSCWYYYCLVVNQLHILIHLIFYLKERTKNILLKCDTFYVRWFYFPRLTFIFFWGGGELLQHCLSQNINFSKFNITLQGWHFSGDPGQPGKVKERIFIHREPGEFLIFSQIWANIREKIWKSVRRSFYPIFFCFFNCLKSINPVLIVFLSEI